MFFNISHINFFVIHKRECQVLQALLHLVFKKIFTKYDEYIFYFC